MLELLQNKVLITAIIANLLAQVLKFIVNFATERKFNFKRLIQTGGMPSSHSSTVAALVTGVLFECGASSIEFAIAGVFATIVLFDAAGVRNAAGKHAEILNTMMEDLQHLLSEGFEPVTLKTFLGHTRIQVMAGTILGIATACISYWITGFPAK